MTQLRKIASSLILGIGVLAAATAAQAQTCQTITHSTPYKVCQTAHGQTRCRTFIRTTSRTVCVYNTEKLKVRQTFKGDRQTAKR